MTPLDKRLEVGMEDMGLSQSQPCGASKHAATDLGASVDGASDAELKRLAEALPYGFYAAFTDDCGSVPHTNLVAFSPRTDCVLSLPGRDKREPLIEYLVASAPNRILSLLERLQAAEQRADAAEAEAARLTRDVEEGTWWKTVVGGSHTPSGGVSVKHLHPLTVKPIYEASKGTPVADVIAGLIFNMEITSNRERFLVEDANERLYTSEASRLSVEGERDAYREYFEAERAVGLAGWLNSSDEQDDRLANAIAALEHMRSQDPGPHPCGEQPGADVAATAALAPDTQHKGASQ